MNRTCGDCRLCCKLMYIGERGTIDGKPYEFVHYPGTWCKHAILEKGERGCELHGTKRKPHACSTFRCLWLTGEGREEDRPDKIKVVVSVEPRASGGSATGIADGPPETYLMVYEGAPGAERSLRARPFLDHITTLYRSSDDIRAIEIVPFGKPWEDRICVHKDKGVHTIRLTGWPEPLDADQDRYEVESRFGPGTATLTAPELLELMRAMTAEKRAEIQEWLKDKIAKRRS